MTPGSSRETAKKVEPEPVQSIRPEPVNNSPTSPKTIRPEAEKRIVSPPKGELKRRSPLPVNPYKKVGRIVGRQRKYEEEGLRGENSISEIVVYRHIYGVHYPTLSKDMRRWYEFFYFTQPRKGEHPFNASTTYEQHTEAYARGRKWIAAYEGENSSSPAVEDSRIVDFQARRATG